MTDLGWMDPQMAVWILPDCDSAELTSLDTTLADGDKVTDDSADVAPAQNLKKSTSLEFIPLVSNANNFNTCSRPL